MFDVQDAAFQSHQGVLEVKIPAVQLAASGSVPLAEIEARRVDSFAIASINHLLRSGMPPANRAQPCDGIGRKCITVTVGVARPFSRSDPVAFPPEFCRECERPRREPMRERAGDLFEDRTCKGSRAVSAFGG